MKNKPVHPFSHPKALLVFSIVVFWERFAYYGTRFLLVLYMIHFLFKDEMLKEIESININAAFIALVYLAPMGGGFFADKYLGRRTSIQWGSLIMIVGYLLLSIPPSGILHQINSFFFTGLSCIVVGSGLFKPNILNAVGELYQKNDFRREAGFSLYYMAVNFGGFAGIALCGWIAYNIGWHYAFLVSATIMTLGFMVFNYGIKEEKFFSSVTFSLVNSFSVQKQLQLPQTVSVLGTNIPKSYLFIPLIFVTCIIPFFLKHHNEIFEYLFYGMLFIASAYFILFLSKNPSQRNAQKIGAIVILMLLTTIFWMMFEQIGSSLLLFAEQHVNLYFLNPAQTSFFNPIWIILLSLPAALYWQRRAFIGRNIPILQKFILGMLALSLGFLIFALSTRFADAQAQTSILWLFLGWGLISVGELLIAPIGLAKVTELAPENKAGIFTGIFFTSSAFAHWLSGKIAELPFHHNSQLFDKLSPIRNWIMGNVEGSSTLLLSLQNFSSTFILIALIAMFTAVVIAILSPFIKQWF